MSDVTFHYISKAWGALAWLQDPRIYAQSYQGHLLPNVCIYLRSRKFLGFYKWEMQVKDIKFVKVVNNGNTFEGFFC